jgi:hypothetical protein
MNPRLLALLGILGALMLTAQGATVVGPDPRAKLDEGVEFQARGPVHEAFAEPSMRRQAAAPLVTKQPPDPVPEMPPEQKPEEANVEWIPGYWAFDDERNDFLWVSGIWRVPPPGRHWVPGYWQQEDAGWQWVSGYWGAQAQSEEQLLPAPPTPIAEAVPPAPDANSGYVPGCWIFQSNGYYWRPGFWAPFRVGWIWITPCYIWTPGGYVFVDGYWDHDFHRRGLLFAPAFINPRFLARPGWVYRPRLVILADVLVQSFFARPAYNHFYFGDYYGPQYARLGFRDWIDFRLGDRHYNSFSYYRWQNRGDPRWERNLRAGYQGRQQGKLARPPRTWTAQVKSGDGPGKTLALLTPVTQVKSQVFKMQALPAAQARQIQKAAQEVHALRQHRATMERQSTGKDAKLNQAAKFELHKPGKDSKPGKDFKDLKPPKDKEFKPGKDVKPPKDKEFKPGKDFKPPKDKEFKPGKDFKPPKDKEFKPGKDVKPPKDKEFKPGKELKPAKELHTPPPNPVHPKISPKTKPQPPAGPRGKQKDDKDKKQPNHHVHRDLDSSRPVLLADSSQLRTPGGPGPSLLARKEL